MSDIQDIWYVIPENHCSSASLDVNIFSQRPAFCPWVGVGGAEYSETLTPHAWPPSLLLLYNHYLRQRTWEQADILLSQQHLVCSVLYLCYNVDTSTSWSISPHSVWQVKPLSSQRVTLSPGVPLITPGSLSKQWPGSSFLWAVILTMLNLSALILTCRASRSNLLCSLLWPVLSPSSDITTLTMGLWTEDIDLTSRDVHSFPIQMVQKHYRGAHIEHFIFS